MGAPRLPLRLHRWNIPTTHPNIPTLLFPLLQDGKVVGWSTVSGKYGFGTALCDPVNRNYATGDAKCQRILGKDGISAGKNVFCSGEP